MFRITNGWIPLLGFAIAAGTSSSQAPSTLTARDYYQELYKAGGLDNLPDEYICCRDDTVPTFFIMAKSDLIKNLIESDGELKNLPPREQANLRKGFLFKVTYNKGLSNGLEYWDPLESGGGYFTDFDITGKAEAKPTPIHMTLRVSWETLRYKIDVYERGSAVPLAEDTGKCEEVKGDIRQHGHREK